MYVASRNRERQSTEYFLQIQFIDYNIKMIYTSRPQNNSRTASQQKLKKEKLSAAKHCFSIALFLSMFLVVPVLALPSNAIAASFDCAKASTPVEQAICKTPALSALDDQLDVVYKTLLASSNDKEQHKAAGRAWMNQVRNQCQNLDCIANAYERRIAELTKSNTESQSGSSSGTQSQSLAAGNVVRFQPSNYVGKVPSEMLKDQKLRDSLMAIIPSNLLTTYEQGFEVTNPVVSTAGFVAGSGCSAHLCNEHESLIVANEANGEIFAALLLDDRVQVFKQQDGSPIPDVVNFWVNQRQPVKVSTAQNAAQTLTAPLVGITSPNEQAHLNKSFVATNIIGLAGISIMVLLIYFWIKNRKQTGSLNSTSSRISEKDGYKGIHKDPAEQNTSRKDQILGFIGLLMVCSMGYGAWQRFSSDVPQATSVSSGSFPEFATVNSAKNPNEGRTTPSSLTSYKDEQIKQVRESAYPTGLTIVRWDAMGYEFDERTRIFVWTDNFGKPTTCSTQQLPVITSTGSLHTIPKFVLDYSVIGKLEGIFVRSLMGETAALRFSFNGNEEFVEILPSLGDGVVSKLEGKMSGFNTSSSMKVSHSASTAFVYDLVAMRRAIGLMKAACR